MQEVQSPDQWQRIEQATESVQDKLGEIPPLLVITGSGLGPFAEKVENPTAVSYEELKNFPSSSVAGHAGKLVKGHLGSTPLLVMSGRKHLYEGISPQDAVLPLRALLNGGVKLVVLSNAAGALNTKFRPGDLMLITDHINNQFQNPLIGPNLDKLGSRFPDMSEPYDRELGKIAREVAREEKILLREGVYIANLGPTYETYAEINMLRQFGDAVGMSTVPENLAARHAGARVLGISLISNSLVARTQEEVTHEEVMEAGREASERFCRLVQGIIRNLSA